MFSPKRLISSLLLSVALVGAAALPAVAQERSFTFLLRGGVATAPDYPGSSSYSPSPDLGFAFGSLVWGENTVGSGFGNIPKSGFALTGAFRYLGERDASDNPELIGLNDIDATVEVGLGVIYRQVNWQVFGELRQGFGGHDGMTGTLGADVVLRPNDRWTITAGPRFNLGNDSYAATYFGVTGAEAAASPSFGAFAADGGLLGAGVEVRATYELDELWAIQGAVTYEHLLNDAADSPITQAGSEDQWRIRLGLSRAFTLRF